MKIITYYLFIPTRFSMQDECEIVKKLGLNCKMTHYGNRPYSHSFKKEIKKTRGQFWGNVFAAFSILKLTLIFVF